MREVVEVRCARGTRGAERGASEREVWGARRKARTDIGGLDEAGGEVVL